MEPMPTLDEIEALVATERKRLIDHLDTHVIPLFVARHVRAFMDARAASMPPGQPLAARAGGEDARPVRAGPPARGKAKPRKDRLPGRGPGGGLLPDDRFAVLRVTPGAHRHVLAALEAGPTRGIAGKDLNALLIRNRYSLDAAESCKTWLGHVGAVTFTAGANLWALTDAYRDAVAGMRPIVPGGADTGRSPSPEEHTGGRIVLRAARAAGAAGINREEAIAAVMAEGYSRSLGKHGYHGLTVAGILVPAPGEGGREHRKVVGADASLGDGR